MILVGTYFIDASKVHSILSVFSPNTKEKRIVYIVCFLLYRERRCYTAQNGCKVSTKIFKSSTFQTSCRIQTSKLCLENLINSLKNEL